MKLRLIEDITGITPSLLLESIEGYEDKSKHEPLNSFFIVYSKNQTFIVPSGPTHMKWGHADPGHIYGYMIESHIDNAALREHAISFPPPLQEEQISAQDLYGKFIIRDKKKMPIINPLYNMYKKSSIAFGFLILNLIILGWLNIFPLTVIIPGITGSTILLLIFLDEIRVRKFIEEKTI